MAPRGRTGGEVIVEALEGAGVRHCFGVPGESYLGVLDALHDSSIGFVSTRHEGGASFMASGYARTSGEIGVCFGTRAVGTANMAIGVHEARQDSFPMVAFAGQVDRALAGREAFQEVDLVAAMTPLTKWAVEIPTADRAAEIMARVLHVATSGRPGPVFVALPQDVCDELTQSAPPGRTRVPAPHPDPDAVSVVLAALLGARRPLLLVGAGVSRSAGARAGLVAFAEEAEVPVITSWRRYDSFPNDHRLFLGSAGLGAPLVVWERLASADVILVLGDRMSENGTSGYRYPRPGARIFQVDIDPAVMVNHRSPELAVTADAGAMLEALLDLLHRDTSHSVPGVAERRAGNAEDRARFEQATTLPDLPGPDRSLLIPPAPVPDLSVPGLPAPGLPAPDLPVLLPSAPVPSARVTGASNPVPGVSYPEVFRALGEVLAPETVVSSDAGNFAGWLARYYRFRRPRTYLGPASGAMGYGLPAAIGAKIALPGTPVVSLSGDGGFLMTMAEIETAVRQRANVVAIVLDNARHGTIRMHQERQHPGRVVGTELGPTDLSLVARGLGAAGWRVDTGPQFAAALREALASPSPSVIQVRMDRDQLSVGDRL